MTPYPLLLAMTAEQWSFATIAVLFVIAVALSAWALMGFTARIERDEVPSRVIGSIRSWVVGLLVLFLAFSAIAYFFNETIFGQLAQGDTDVDIPAPAPTPTPDLP